MLTIQDKPFCGTLPSSVIVTGAGWSLHKKKDRIIAMLRATPGAAIFDVNGHFSDRTLDQLKALPNLKVLFARKFGKAGPEYGKLYARTRQFLELENSWVMIPNDETTKMLSLHLGDHVIRYAECEGFKDYESVPCSTWQNNGSMAALGAIPSEIKDVHLFGFDAITMESYHSIDTPCEKDFSLLVADNSIGAYLADMKDRHNVRLYA